MAVRFSIKISTPYCSHEASLYTFPKWVRLVGTSHSKSTQLLAFKIEINNLAAIFKLGVMVGKEPNLNYRSFLKKYFFWEPFV